MAFAQHPEYSGIAFDQAAAQTVSAVAQEWWPLLALTWGKRDPEMGKPVSSGLLRSERKAGTGSVGATAGLILDASDTIAHGVMFCVSTARALWRNQRNAARNVPKANSQMPPGHYRLLMQRWRISAVG